MIIQDESQKGIVGSIHERIESLAMYSSRVARSPQFNNNRQSYPRRNFRSMYCDFCNMNGHIRADYNKLKKCDNCNVTGPMKDN